MNGAARSTEDHSEPAGENAAERALARGGANLPNLPVILNAQQLSTNLNAPPSGVSPLRYVDVPKEQSESRGGRKKDAAVLRGLKDLQQLQKQTIAVLESVKANLEDIQQVLRSPEATRGLEKQQNAATLLSKGFAREAVEQSHGAVALLPANPDAHLLLALSLAADQQFDNSLAAARKGLALFDRRTHPLAIEAGLLHAIAALGCGAEAAERWAAIIEILPIPVLLEHIGRIATCYPPDAPEGQLDQLLSHRLERASVESQNASTATRPTRTRRVETAAADIPIASFLAGLDAASQARLSHTHRNILAHIARRLQTARDSTEIIRFLTECVVPLANRDLMRSAGALGRSSVKRLLRLQADAMTLHRAMTKLEMASAGRATREIATLLKHWRRAGKKVASARRYLLLSIALLLGGAGIFAYVLFVLDAIHGKQFFFALGSIRFDALWVGPGMLVAGSLVGLLALMGRTWHVELPHGRPRLSPDEIRFLRSSSVKHSLRAALSTTHR